jgi:ribosomal protein S18 acetylase RimI-like enzyme
VFSETFGPANTAANMRTYIDEAFNVARISQEITSARSSVIVAEREGTIIGYARLAEHGRSVRFQEGIELVRMYVDHAHHGAGIADRLMDACIDEARRRGYASIWLGVWEHNPRAQRFYARRGFARTGEPACMLGDDRQTDWILELRFQARAARERRTRDIGR